MDILKTQGYTVIKKLRENDYFVSLKVSKGDNIYIANVFKIQNKGLNSAWNAETQSLVRLKEQNCFPHLECISKIINDRVENYIVLTKEVKGYSLRELVDNQTPFVATFPFSVALTDQMLEALDNLHGVEIAHRGIKPENILYDYNSKNFTLVNLTYSCGLFQEKDTCPLRLASVVNYSAPEYMREINNNISPSLEEAQRNDLYALGAILHLLLFQVPAGQEITFDPFEKYSGQVYQGHDFTDLYELILQLLLYSDKVTASQMLTTWRNSNSLKKV
jgi:serine/threonine protein kinase